MECEAPWQTCTPGWKKRAESGKSAEPARGLPAAWCTAPSGSGHAPETCVRPRCGKAARAASYCAGGPGETPACLHTASWDRPLHDGAPSHCGNGSPQSVPATAADAACGGGHARKEGLPAPHTRNPRLRRSGILPRLLWTCPRPPSGNSASCPAHHPSRPSGRRGPAPAPC